MQIMVYMGMPSEKISSHTWPCLSLSLSHTHTITKDANGFVGSIPSELGHLTLLQSLLVADNQLTGFVPSELGLLNMLTKLELRNNKLSGHIPSSLLKFQFLSKLHWRPDCLRHMVLLQHLDAYLSTISSLAAARVFLLFDNFIRLFRQISWTLAITI